MNERKARKADRLRRLEAEKKRHLELLRGTGRGGRAGEDAASGERPPPDDPRLVKYRKMLQMRVPEGAVHAKMRAEGLDPAWLDAGADAATDPSAARKVDDVRLAKFLRMLQMRVPRGAVEAKMRAEGLDPRLLDGDVEASPGEGRGGDDDAVAVDVAAETPPRRGPPLGCDRKPRVKTRRVYLDYPEGPGGGDVPPGGWWRPEGPSKAFSASMGTALEDCFALGGGDRGSKKGSTSNPARAGTVGEWAPSRKRSLVRELCGDRQGRGSTCFNRTSTLECLSDHICVKKTHLPFERP